MRINYHGKDILFKALTESYKDKALTALGLNFSKIKCVLPNELPEVKISARRSDMLFELENGELLLIEFESANNFTECYLKYSDYILRIINRYFNETREIKKINLVVVYSSEVRESISSIDAKSLKVEGTSVYLHNQNGDEKIEILKAKILKGDEITSEDILIFMLIPLMGSAKERSQVVEDCFELAKQIKNQTLQLSAIGGILASGTRFISPRLSRKIKEWIRMFDVLDELMEEMAEEKANEKLKEVAKNFLKFLKIEEVARNMNLSVDEVQQLVK